MSVLRRVQYLLPGRRRAEEREMRAEFEALQSFAEPRELGNLTLAAESARAVWGWAWLDSLFADVRYACRVLARQPSFTAVAVLSLGLGIGANAAIYSLIDRVLWRQLPVSDPDRLVTTKASYSMFTFSRLRELSGDVLEGAALSSIIQRDLDVRPGRVEMVTGNYFQLLGVRAHAGRTLIADDDRRDQAERVAVLSYAYWRSAFGGEPVVGRTIRITKLPFTIVGVAPREFFGVTVGDAPDLWIPLSTQPAVMPGRNWIDDRNTFFANLVARIRPGTSIERAAAALTPIVVRIDLERARPDLPAYARQQILSHKVVLLPLAAGLSSLRDRFSKPLRVLFAMVGLGLLLACVNVMSLQFARADERRRELSVRLAIGASRGRIVRQLLTEAAVLALLGGALGLALCRPAAAGVAGLISMGGEPVRLDLTVDSGVLAFVLAVSMGAAVVCGLIPALRATRRGVADGLQQGSRGTTAAPARRVLGRSVAAVQLGLSVVLIAGAFLFSFSLYRLSRFDTGLNRDRLLVLEVDPAEAGFKDAQVAALNLRLQERLGEIAGVRAVSFSGTGIYTNRGANTQATTDAVSGAPGPQLNAWWDRVGPGYFTTLGARLLAGRDFDGRDRKGAPAVTVVTKEFARHFFPDGNAIGRSVYMGKSRDTFRVIGVVDNIRTDIRKEPRRTFYLAQAQSDDSFFTTRFLVRAAADPAAVAGYLRQAVRAENAALRVVSIDSADQLLNRTLDLDRVVAVLSFAFGLLAVTLAAVGVYGMLAYDVARRRSEIGIRMAVGATRGSVLRLVFREVAVVGSAGVAMGLAGSLALGQVVEGLIFDLKPGDPRVLAAAIAVLIVVAFAAALAPARRAATMDPMRALRAE
jgi:predicted permease